MRQHRHPFPFFRSTPDPMMADALPPTSRRSSFGLWPVVLVAIGFATVVAACSGGSAYRAETSEFAQRYLPNEREVDHHPDSLALLAVRETENHLKFKLQEDYAVIMETWSSRPRDISANRSPLRSYTYATLWSRELSIASLEPEAAFSSLSKDQARRLLERRNSEYEDELQIDIYWFGSPNRSVVAGPGATVRLTTSRDSTYRPVRSDYGPIREAFVEAGRTALYRRNTFFFKRSPHGSDVLEGTSGVTLSIRPTSSTRDFRFRWTWGEDPNAGSSPAGATSGSSGGDTGTVDGPSR